MGGAAVRRAGGDGVSLLALRGDPSRLTPPDSDARLGDRYGRLRLRCPHCAWEPRRSDRWACLCGQVWNTFDTGGVCPGCGHRWEQTQCLLCRRWAAHLDWYVWEGDDAPQ